MDKFIWLNTTTGKSYLNLADISVISFHNGNEFCDIHMRSGTIFTTDAESGHSLFESHENYVISKATAKIYEVSA